MLGELAERCIYVAPLLQAKRWAGARRRLAERFQTAVMSAAAQRSVGLRVARAALKKATRGIYQLVSAAAGGLHSGREAGGSRASCQCSTGCQNGARIDAWAADRAHMMPPRPCGVALQKRNESEEPVFSSQVYVLHRRMTRRLYLLLGWQRVRGSSNTADPPEATSGYHRGPLLSH